MQKHVLDLLPNHTHHRGVDSNICVWRSPRYAPYHLTFFIVTEQLISNPHQFFLRILRMHVSVETQEAALCSSTFDPHAFLSYCPNATSTTPAAPRR